LDRASGTPGLSFIFEQTGRYRGERLGCHLIGANPALFDLVRVTVDSLIRMKKMRSA
jgi:hypothetical protein